MLSLCLTRGLYADTQLVGGYEASRQTLNWSVSIRPGCLILSHSGLCSPDLNISNVHPIDLTFGIDESFPTFISCIMLNTEDTDRFQQNRHRF